MPDSKPFNQCPACAGIERYRHTAVFEGSRYEGCFEIPYNPDMGGHRDGPFVLKDVYDELLGEYADLVALHACTHKHCGTMRSL